MTQQGVHTEHEDDPWTIDVGDHAERTDSPEYRRSRSLMVKLVQLCQPWWFGDGPYQDHHGGGIWLKDETGWFLVFGSAGIEWSAQFCADPAKVDLLRQLAGRVVAKFPDTVSGYETLGYHDGQSLLSTAITDADGVERWTDGIFNASVALPAAAHTGVLPTAGGAHHYPKPIVDIERFKHDDFILFVTDEQGAHLAVTPVGRPGSGDGRVRVAWAEPSADLDRLKAGAEQTDQSIVLPADHPVSQAAFAQQA